MPQSGPHDDFLFFSLKGLLQSFGPDLHGQPDNTGGPAGGARLGRRIFLSVQVTVAVRGIQARGISSRDNVISRREAGAPRVHVGMFEFCTRGAGGQVMFSYYSPFRLNT